MSQFARHIAGNVLITGGAGFIGANLAAHLLAFTDRSITLFDNLSLPGSDRNVTWLESQAAPGRMKLIHGDVRDRQAVRAAAENADEIYHLACRCGLPADARADYDVNATGTLNVLDAARAFGRNPFFLYLSTSKVYTRLHDLPFRREVDHFSSADPNFRGIPETARADCYDPFTCSRGAADVYVRDYARLYGLPTVVLRLDTAAGPRQFANQQHGWVAHLVNSTLSGQPVRVYGTGFQVHDVLHVADVVQAMIAARAYSGVTAGKVYNIGGGPTRAVSVNQVLDMIQRLCYRAPQIQREPRRPGDAPYFAADSEPFRVDTGWMPRRSLAQTVRDVIAFWHANLEVAEHSATYSFTHRRAA